MTGLMLLITALNAKGGSAASLFEMITEIAVLLTMLPYFYSCIDLLRIESTSQQGRLSCIAAVLGCGFCFIALVADGNGPSQPPEFRSSAYIIIGCRLLMLLFLKR